MELYQIINKEVITRWNSSNRKHLEANGYSFTKYGDPIKIKTEHLTASSTLKVKIKCPICKKEYDTQYRILHRQNKYGIPKNTICSNSCYQKLRMEKLSCDACGNKKDHYRYIENKRCCDKCYAQIKSKGNTYHSMQQKNTIIVLHDYAEVILRNRHGDIIGKTKIDIEDIDKVKNIKWRLTNNGYVYGLTDQNTSLKLHRFVMDVDNDEMEVDHIYQDTLDNRKRYLRIVTKQENLDNRLKTDQKKIYISGIEKYSISNGDGIRMTIFGAGCEHHCSECHNPETWNINNGTKTSLDVLYEDIKKYPYNITFSGGDPFFQWRQFYELAKSIKALNKNVWIYTGYTYEEIIADNQKRLLLEQCDVLVDGRFIKELKDLKLKFKGSSNQRIIDIQDTLKSGIIKLKYN